MLQERRNLYKVWFLVFIPSRWNDVFSVATSADHQVLLISFSSFFFSNLELRRGGGRGKKSETFLASSHVC